MSKSRPSRTFIIDGHQVTVTFAESGGAAVIGRIKQILLSAYVNYLPSENSSGTFDFSDQQSDNANGGKPDAP
jgi:hypothetical protein